MRHLAFIFLLTTFSLSCVSKPLDEISLPTTDNVNANNTEKDDDNINDDTINSSINDDTIDEGTPENTTEIKPNGQLIADGNDENTYNLITSSGYNYEAPDYSGEHASNPFRHIQQSYDNELKKYVFDFWLHINNDDDRGLANVKDRQRNEIKTDAKSPDYMFAYQGETLKLSWKFKLPSGMKTTNKFSHIHQLKGIDNKEGTADVANPLITFTLRTLSNGKQEFEIIYTYPTDENKKNTYIARASLDDFLGQWVQVEEIVKFDENGEYSVVITRLEDEKKIIETSEKGLFLWRNNAVGIRPKWGLYRNFGASGSLKYLLRDECLKFADFSIIKVK